MKKFIVLSIILLMLAGFAITSSVLACPIDIKPESCPNPLNVKGKGVLPVAILGTEDFDATQVDPATVELEGVLPLRWALEDVATPYGGDPIDPEEPDCSLCTTEGSDGYMDLVLKFDTQAVVEEIGDVDIGEFLVIMLTGNLFDGTPFEVEDVIIIIKKGK